MIAIFPPGEKRSRACNRNSYFIVVEASVELGGQEQEACDWLRSEAGIATAEYARRDIFLGESALFNDNEPHIFSL
jgi:hypothetical protein